MTGVRIVLGKLDVDFGIEPGGTAIFGPGGAGKSLLLETVAGLVRPDSGRILLDDAILFDAAAAVHLPPGRRRAALIPQTDSLFPGMSPKQNLMFAARRYPRLERHRRVAEIVDKFQLNANSPRLRWILARALITEPKLLLIDDVGLDAALLREIRENTSAPVLFASRNLDLCCAADRMLVLANGRILQRGTPRQVIDRPESVEVARLLGIGNVLEATVGALDPSRNSSTLDFAHFSLNGPYFPGHFRGDRVWVAVAAENLRAHAGDAGPGPNRVPLELVGTVPRAQSVLLEFAGGVSVALSYRDYAPAKDNKSWLVEFPPSALRIL